MPQSLSAVYIHLVFSTKHRQPFLKDEGLRTELHSFLGGTSKTLECPSLIVGGVEDHVKVVAFVADSLDVLVHIVGAGDRLVDGRAEVLQKLLDLIVHMTLRYKHVNY